MTAVKKEYHCGNADECDCIIGEKCNDCHQCGVPEQERERLLYEKKIYEPCGDCKEIGKCPCPHRGYCLCDNNDGICIHSDLLKKGKEEK